MRTNLAYIDEVATKGTDNAKETIRYGGFSLETEVESEKLRGYKAEADSLKRHLASIGITPLAVLPRAWWKGIVTNSKLIEVDNSGEIVLAPQDWMLFATGLVSAAMIVAFGALSIATGWFLTYELMGGVFGHWDKADAFILSTLWGGILTAMFGSSFLRRSLAAKVVSKFFGDLLYDMWENEDGNSARRYTYDFPTPPKDVADTLVKLTTKQFLNDFATEVRIAAAPDAFALKVSQAGILAQVSQQRWEDFKASVVNELSDPIVTVRRGGAVAVIAQYGEFPVEKEVVDKVIGSGISWSR